MHFSLVFCAISSALRQLAASEHAVELEVLVEGSPKSLFWRPGVEDARVVARDFAAEHGLDRAGCAYDECVHVRLATELRLLRAKEAAHRRESELAASALPLFKSAPLRSAPTTKDDAVISLFAGHDSSIAISWRGRVQCVLELERLFKERYYRPPTQDATRFYTEWIHALTVIRDRCECEDGPCPRHFHQGVIVESGLDTECERLWLPQIAEEVVSVERWRAVDHHEAHASLAFHSSPFRSALVVSYDGHGNDGYFNGYFGTHDKIQRIAQVDYALGLAYTLIATALPEVSGIALDDMYACNESMVEGDELSMQEPLQVLDLNKYLSLAGKLMGYAAAGSPDGNLRHALRYLFESSGHHYGRRKSQGLPKALLRRACSSPEGQRTLAASAQLEFERFVADAVHGLLRHVGHQNVEGLVLVGGCALNVLANQRLHDSLKVSAAFGSGRATDEKVISELGFFVPVAPNDSGLSVGGLWAVTPPLVRQPLQYQGFRLWDKDVLDNVARLSGAQNLTALGGVDYLAELLAGGPAWQADSGPGATKAKPIIAVVRGRQEFGPRALGHRSLLAVPDSLEVRERMNRLKARSWYRPVAPIIANEVVEEVFGQHYESPYMSLAPKVKESVRAKFPALAHLDATARHQSVGRRDDPWVHALLLAVGGWTGLAALINTSFNTRGKPIVNTVDDCLQMLEEQAELDYVLIEDWLFKSQT